MENNKKDLYESILLGICVTIVLSMMLFMARSCYLGDKQTSAKVRLKEIELEKMKVEMGCKKTTKTKRPQFSGLSITNR